MFKNFKLYELVSPYTYHLLIKRGLVKVEFKDNKIKELSVNPRAWHLIDVKLMGDIQKLRTALNKPIRINNWHKFYPIIDLFIENNFESLYDYSTGLITMTGLFTNRGLRMLNSSIGSYQTTHLFGAFDYDVIGMKAEEVRNYLLENQKKYPNIKRLEPNVNWVHADIWGDHEGMILINMKEKK